MMHTLITGANGFLGYHLCREMRGAGWRVTGSSRTAEHVHDEADAWLRFELNGGDAAALLDAVQPDLLIHAAALAARSDCEADPAFAMRVNVHATEELGTACAAHEIPMYFISTDLVFDGSAAPYREGDSVSPASVYGESKAEAERLLMQVCPGAFVLRCSLMYGSASDGSPGSFLSWNVGKPLRGETVQLYANQYRRPLFVHDVARVVLALHAAQADPGIYHCAGPDRLSRVEMGAVLARAFDLPTAMLQSVELPRMDDTSLCTGKVEAATGVVFTGFEEGIAIVRGVGDAGASRG
jgi:dTDP-4-dehydrorhamnose reductase